MSAIQDEHGNWVDEDSGELLAVDASLEALVRRLYDARRNQNGWAKEVAKIQPVVRAKMKEAGVAPMVYMQSDDGLKWRIRDSSSQKFDAGRVIAWLEDSPDIIHALDVLGSRAALDILQDILPAVSSWKASALPQDPIGDAIRRAITYTSSQWVEVAEALVPAPEVK
jgi:hypothetical protein